MVKLKIAITIDQSALEAVDRLVVERRFSSRSQAIQEAVDEKLVRISGSRLAAECSKLDPVFERSLADQGLESESAIWPAY